MSTALLDARVGAAHAPGAAAAAIALPENRAPDCAQAPAGAGSTLDAVLCGLWDGLERGDAGVCPACEGAMVVNVPAMDGEPEASCIACGAGLR
jgi:hypothetical protein